MFAEAGVVIDEATNTEVELHPSILDGSELLIVEEKAEVVIEQRVGIEQGEENQSSDGQINTEDTENKNDWEFKFTIGGSYDPATKTIMVGGEVFGHGLPELEPLRLNFVEKIEAGITGELKADNLTIGGQEYIARYLWNGKDFQIITEPIGKSEESGDSDTGPVINKDFENNTRSQIEEPDIPEISTLTVEEVGARSIQEAQTGIGIIKSPKLKTTSDRLSFLYKKIVKRQLAAREANTARSFTQTVPAFETPARVSKADTRPSYNLDATRQQDGIRPGPDQILSHDAEPTEFNSISLIQNIELALDTKITKIIEKQVVETVPFRGTLIAVPAQQRSQTKKESEEVDLKLPSVAEINSLEIGDQVKMGPSAKRDAEPPDVNRVTLINNISNESGIKEALENFESLPVDGEPVQLAKLTPIRTATTAIVPTVPDGKGHGTSEFIGDDELHVPAKTSPARRALEPQSKIFFDRNQHYNSTENVVGIGTKFSREIMEVTEQSNEPEFSGLEKNVDLGRKPVIENVLQFKTRNAASKKTSERPSIEVNKDYEEAAEKNARRQLDKAQTFKHLTGEVVTKEINIAERLRPIHGEMAKNSIKVVPLSAFTIARNNEQKIISDKMTMVDWQSTRHISKPLQKKGLKLATIADFFNNKRVTNPVREPARLILNETKVNEPAAEKKVNIFEILHSRTLSHSLQPQAVLESNENNHAVPKQNTIFRSSARTSRPAAAEFHRANIAA